MLSLQNPNKIWICKPIMIYVDKYSTLIHVTYTTVPKFCSRFKVQNILKNSQRKLNSTETFCVSHIKCINRHVKVWFLKKFRIMTEKSATGAAPREMRAAERVCALNYLWSANEESMVADEYFNLGMFRFSEREMFLFEILLAFCGYFWICFVFAYEIFLHLFRVP